MKGEGWKMVSVCVWSCYLFEVGRSQEVLEKGFVGLQLVCQSELRAYLH